MTGRAADSKTAHWSKLQASGSHVDASRPWITTGCENMSGSFRAIFSTLEHICIVWKKNGFEMQSEHHTWLL
jgi:hypothetical protein